MKLLNQSLNAQYKLLNKLYNNNIPNNIKNRIEFFKTLDEEYKSNSKEREIGVMFSPKLVNKNWRGFWLKATGMDEYLYVFYLVYSKKMSEVGIEIDPIDVFKNSHPKEKFIPYSISIINQDLFGGIDNVQTGF